MSWSNRTKRQSPTQARIFWSAELDEAARAALTVRIACRQEDHRALRQEASRIGHEQDRDVVVDTTTPRLVSVSFTRRDPSA